MTFRSSAVIPPVRTLPPAVAAIVIVCSPSNASWISHAPDLAGLIHGILLYGNIAVKAVHIRLLAFAEPGNRASLAIGSIAKRGLTDLLRRTMPRINRFAARCYCVLACDRSTGEDQVPVE